MNRLISDPRTTSARLAPGNCELVGPRVTMNLSEPFIRKPVMTTLCAVSAAIFGMAAYFALPVSDLPDVAYPVISVTTNYPGASPQIMANNVSTPLEIQMMEIEGLHLITSRNQEGVSSIVLQFVLEQGYGPGGGRGGGRHSARDGKSSRPTCPRRQAFRPQILIPSRSSTSRWRRIRSRWATSTTTPTTWSPSA